jgi:hypothetical protein
MTDLTSKIISSLKCKTLNILAANVEGKKKR